LAQKTIKAVLFDLGDTLINFGKVDRATIFMEAARASYGYLKQAGQPIGSFRVYVWRNILGMRVKTMLSKITGRDFDSLEVIKYSGTLQGWKLSDEQWEDVNKCWYEPLRRRGRIEGDLAGTLGKLRDSGLKLGIVSNTFVHACSLDAHLKELGILDFFSLRIYSYQLKFRKPDKRIFLEAAKRLSVEPEETLFVGDRINKDVNGAIRTGMVPVLKSAYTSDGKKLPDGVLKIDKIAELPEIIAGMNS
jgi:HAD superfamily hydrolase (TIGR01549 family)